MRELQTPCSSFQKKDTWGQVERGERMGKRVEKSKNSFPSLQGTQLD